MNGLVNIQTCVPTPEYSHLLTGKLLVYLIFTKEVADYYYNKYGDHLIGVTTTSLFGKSSMYNRLKQLSYLGLSDGMSAVYIPDDEWHKLLKEYYSRFPNTQTNRLAPVKFQIIDKLAKKYKSEGRDFPYTYQSLSFRRGVYFGYMCKNGKDVLLGKQDMPLYELPTVHKAYNMWKDRWFVPRFSRIVESGKSPIRRPYNYTENIRRMREWVC